MYVKNTGELSYNLGRAIYEWYPRVGAGVAYSSLQELSNDLYGHLEHNLERPPSIEKIVEVINQRLCPVPCLKALQEELLSILYSAETVDVLANDNY